MRKLLYLLILAVVQLFGCNQPKGEVQLHPVFNGTDTTLAYFTADTTTFEIQAKGAVDIYYTLNPFASLDKYKPYEAPLRLSKPNIICYYGVAQKTSDTLATEYAYLTVRSSETGFSRGVLQKSFHTSSSLSSLGAAVDSVTSPSFETPTQLAGNMIQAKALIYLPAPQDYTFRLEHSDSVCLAIMGREVLTLANAKKETTLPMKTGMYLVDLKYLKDSKAPELSINSKYMNYNELPPGILFHYVNEAGRDELDVSKL